MLVGCGNTDELEQKIKEQKAEISLLEDELESTKKHNNSIESRIEEETEDGDESSDDESEEVSSDDEESKEEISENEDSYNTNNIDHDVNKVVDADLKDTTITDLRINEDASTDEERYIVLVDLEWDVKNSAGTTKEMLDMYSDHIAAKLAEDKYIHELVLFWTVPYHNEDDNILKRTYENKEDGMFLEDEFKDVDIFG